MCPLLWMVGTLLIVPGFRTAAESLEEASSKKDEQKCVPCTEYDDDFGLIFCDKHEKGTHTVKCPGHNPECWSVANATWTDMHIVCGVVGKPTNSFRFALDPVFRNLSIIYQCSEPKCPRTYPSVYAKSMQSATNLNGTKGQNITNMKTAPIEKVLSNITHKKFAEIGIANGTIGTVGTISTIDKPESELLKQDTIASEDDEDESEGSGASEEYKNKRLASSASDPSSYLPAQENKATHTARNIMTVAMSMSIILICVDL